MKHFTTMSPAEREQYIECFLPPKSKLEDGPKREEAKRQVMEWNAPYTNEELAQQAAQNAEYVKTYVEKAKKVGQQLSRIGASYATTKRLSVISPRARAYRSPSRRTHTAAGGGNDGGEESDPEPPCRFSLNPHKKELHSIPLAVASPRHMLHGLRSTS